MAEESQLLYDAGSNVGVTSVSGGSNMRMAGTRLTITDRTVTKLRFLLAQEGTAAGTITFKIWAIGSPGSVLASKLQGNAADIAGTPTWYEVTLDTPTYVNQEVRIGIWSDDGASGSNRILIYNENSAPDASRVTYGDGTTWTDDPGGFSGTYVYTYIAGSQINTAPTVTTQAVSAIAATTATGNGNVTGLGIPVATQHGHVWAIYPNAGTEVSTKTQLGVPAATGAYTSSMTGLVQNTLYYSRAYIQNSVDAYFGQQVTFTTSGGVPVVTTFQPRDVMVASALGHGSLDNLGGTAAVTQFGMCWVAGTGIPSTADSKTQEGASLILGEYYTAMTGLTGTTLYTARAYATNASSTGYGASKTFTTQAIGAPIVSTETTINIQPNQATGRGTIIDVGLAAITAHGHVWDTSVNPTVALTTKTDAGTAGTGSFNSEITGLAAGTSYYIRTYATNSYGTGYGNNDQISDVPGENKGNIVIIGESFAYSSETGLQYYIRGVRF